MKVLGIVLGTFEGTMLRKSDGGVLNIMGFCDIKGLGCSEMRKVGKLLITDIGKLDGPCPAWLAGNELYITLGKMLRAWAGEWLEISNGLVLGDALKW